MLSKIIFICFAIIGTIGGSLYITEGLDLEKRIAVGVPFGILMLIGFIFLYIWGDTNPDEDED